MIHVFVINPETGKDNFVENLRKQLELIPNITYYVFDTRYSGDEKELVKRIVNLFEDEELRIYCCGGSGTLRNIIDGLDDLQKIEIAFYPIGMTNDFLKCFRDDKEKFYNLTDIIEGEVVCIDYISSNYGKALNAISLGIDSEVIKTINGMRQWNLLYDATPYILGFLHAFFRSKKRKYVIEVDGISLDTVATEIVIGNGHVVGGKMQFFEQSKVDDGICNYGVLITKNIIQKIKAVKYLTTENSDKKYNMLIHGTCNRVKIKREDEKPFEVSFDGELVNVSELLEIEIKHKEMKFVLPKGVALP